MKFFLVIATSWLYQNVAASNNEGDNEGYNEGDIERLKGDIRLTFKQRECLLNEHAEGCSQDSRGFDTTVSKWDTYQKVDIHGIGRYEVPMLVKTKTYPSDRLPKLWENLLWAKKEYHDKTNIELIFIDDHDVKTKYTKGYITPFNGGQCWSYVGNMRATANWESQQMDIGWCYYHRMSYLHEIMHALGFWHEHTRHDRDKFVTANDSAGRSADCKKHVEGRLDTSGTKYDLESIMHYPEGHCGIKVKDRTMARIVGNVPTFSVLDLVEINAQYPPFSEATF